MFRLAQAMPLHFGMQLGTAIGSGAWLVLRYERECSLRHLRLAFPDWTARERWLTGRESFRNLGRSFFELFHFDEILAEQVTPRPYVIGRDLEDMDRLTAENRPGIFITGHIGNWELMAAWAAHRGLRLHEIVRKLYDPRLDQLLNDHRRRYNYLPLARGGQELVADIMNVIANNGALGLLMDQDTKVRGVYADWFGYPSWTPSGPAYLCYQLGLDALVGTMHRNPGGGHTFTCSAPIPRPQTGNTKADIIAYTEILNRHLCDRIRQHPAEWVWMHRRWKTRPADEPPEKHPAPAPQKPFRLLRWAERIIEPAACALSWETADKLGAALGRLLHFAWRGRRKMVRQNLGRAFPEQSRLWTRQIAREAFANYGRVLMDYLRQSLMNGKFLQERVEIEGLEHFAEAYEQNRGVVVISAHFGGWEPAMWKMAAEGFPLHMAARRLKNNFLNQRLVWMRRAHGVESYAEKNAGYRIVRALRSGQAVVCIMDQQTTGARAVTAEFFGRPVQALASPARLAHSRECPVLPGYSLRAGPGRFRVVIGEPIPFELRDSPEETLRHNTQRYLRALEKLIAAHPAQWFWLHQFWK